MRYSNYEQRQMDIASGLELDRHARKANENPAAPALVSKPDLSAAILPVTVNTRDARCGAGIHEITLQVVTFADYSVAGLTALLRETADRYVREAAARRAA